MSGPQVTLTFAGDESKLTQSFDKVGAAAKGMSGSIGAASREVSESAGGFDRAGEAADGAEGKAQGFSDTLTGTKDIMGGAAEIAKGNLFEGFVMAGQGAADLAGGLASFVIPAIKNMSVSMVTNAASSARSTVALGAHRVASLAGAAASNIAAVALRGVGVAMRFATGPIGIAIGIISLLVGGLVLAYKRSETFRAVVQGAMRGVQTAFGWVVTKGGELVGWFKALPGRIGGFFGGLSGVITRPFSAAFSGIRSFWNNTVGGKGFSVPDWIPGVGGKSFRIPYFHTGGIVSGAMGSESLAILKAGEKVTGGRNNGGSPVVVFRSDGTAGGRAVLEFLRYLIKVESGGDVQAALGQ